MSNHKRINDEGGAGRRRIGWLRASCVAVAGCLLVTAACGEEEDASSGYASSGGSSYSTTPTVASSGNGGTVASTAPATTAAPATTTTTRAAPATTAAPGRPATTVAATQTSGDLSRLSPTAAAKSASEAPRFTASTSGTMGDFLQAVADNVDRYWTKIMTRAGYREPFVYVNWLRPGQRVTTKCTDGNRQPEVTDDNSAAYCFADDTIYVSQQFAYNLWQGKLPGRTARRAPGDFGVAYVVAHEYAHNIQHELGILKDPKHPTWHTELQADCMAGAWANSAYYQGILDPGDVEEALATADLVGDFDFSDPNHHGTPKERVDAWRLGYNTGNPAMCNRWTNHA